jgi:hypothetical protein
MVAAVLAWLSNGSGSTNRCQLRWRGMWQQVLCSTGPLSKMSLGGCTINRTWDHSTWSHQHDIELKRLGLQLPPQLATGVSRACVQHVRSHTLLNVWMHVCRCTTLMTWQLQKHSFLSLDSLTSVSGFNITCTR